jgi:dienelactone hydrolase
MREQSCEFGPALNLVGVLTDPPADTVRQDSPIVIMLNAGLLHRVGPHRMSVELARRFAEHGIRSLRFDISGRGDSDSSRISESDESSVLSDIADAMSFLEQRYQVRKFVLLGLCAGSDNSHAVAVRDPRVAGIVHLDGHGYWTRRSYMQHYVPRMSRPQAWVNFTRRSLFGETPQEDVDRVSVEQLHRKPFDPKAEVEREVQSLVDRGTQLLYIYTGGVARYYNYAEQFFDMFEGLNPRGLIEVEHYPNADHTYTFPEDRERMFARVIDWYTSRNWSVAEKQPDEISV